jgi:uncharacterized membrane protein YebE (DUF533 family)
MNALTQMRLLVNLAKIDGKVAEREKKFINNIGRANGLDAQTLNSLFEDHDKVIILNDLTSDEKFDCIYRLVQLMKIDERMYQEEIRFCGEIAVRLGYRPEVLAELILHVSADQNPDKEAHLRKLTNKFLN